MLSVRKTVLLKIESTQGTDANPTDANAILCSDVAPQRQQDQIERKNLKKSLAADPKVATSYYATVSFTCELKGSGIAGTSPEIGDALQACGLKEIVVADTSVEYVPEDGDSHKTATIYVNRDGRLMKLLGCVGTAQLNLNSGEFGTVQFTFTGHLAPETDQLFSEPVYDNEVPPVLIGVSFSVGGYSAAIGALNLSLNNEVKTPKSMQSNDGYADFYIAKQMPEGTVNPEAALLATKNFVADMQNNESLVFDTGLIGTTAGNRYQIKSDNMQIHSVNDGDLDGKITDELNFGLYESGIGANDFISIKFS